MGLFRFAFPLADPKACYTLLLILNLVDKLPSSKGAFSGISYIIQAPELDVQGPIHSDLKLRKQHFALLRCSLCCVSAALHHYFASAGHLPLLVPLSWITSPCGILCFLLKLGQTPGLPLRHILLKPSQIKVLFTDLEPWKHVFWDFSHDIYLILLYTIVCRHVLLPLKGRTNV